MASETTGSEFWREGGLDSQPLPRVFFELCLARKTGALDLLTEPPPQGKILKRLFLHHGASFYVQGGSVDETLGKILVGLKKLGEEEHEKLLLEAGKDYGQLEERLIQSGRFPPNELLEALTIQTGTKIKRCFAWNRGHYLFKETPENEILSKYVLHQLPPEKLLLEGVQEAYPLPRILKEFAGIEKKTFHRSARLEEMAPMLGLPPVLLRLTLKLPPDFTFGPAARGLNPKPELSHPFLLALYLGGMITLSPEEENFPLGRAAAAPAKDQTPPPVAKKPEPPPPPPKKEEPKLPIEQLLDRELNDREVLAEIERMSQLFSKPGTTFFEILGVEVKTPPEKVKRIYFRMAKLFHPDARQGLYQGQIKAKVEEVFTHISEAYNTLSARDLREPYVQSLKSKVSSAQMDEAHHAIEAETEFQKAEVFLRKGNFAAAETALRRSVELAPNEPEYRLYHAWAEYKVKGPGQARRASQTIEEALKARPQSAEGHYFLGQLYKAEGLNEDADQCYQKVLELNPRHIEAQRELRLSAMRKEKNPPKKGGIFSRN
jgi:tetratricopeptide (TPR) repeat protein